MKPEARPFGHTIRRATALRHRLASAKGPNLDTRTRLTDRSLSSNNCNPIPCPIQHNNARKALDEGSFTTLSPISQLKRRSMRHRPPPLSESRWILRWSRDEACGRRCHAGVNSNRPFLQTNKNDVLFLRFSPTSCPSSSRAARPG